MSWTRQELEQFIMESNSIEGIRRTPTTAEVAAHEIFLAKPVSVGTLCELVSVLQPNARLRDQEGLDVRVGNYVPPPGGPSIHTALELTLSIKYYTPWERHLAYERLHPFTDGNGRSGRALWLHEVRDLSLGFLHRFYYQTLQ